MKISKAISKSVLTISPHFIPPKGGIAQVVYSYDKLVFETFKAIKIKKGKNIWVGRLHILTSILKLLLKLIFDRNIKIVHIHTASYNRFYFNTFYLRIAKIFSKKVIMHIHGGAFADYYKTNPKWIKKMLNKCDVVVALTDEWKVFFEKEVGCNNVIVVDNIVEEPVIQNKRYNNKNIIHCVFLGKICRAKGIFDLVEVIQLHKNEFKDKLVLHIGGGGEYQRLTNIIDTQSLNDIIKYEGWVSGEKKIELMNLSQVYILPSYTEGLPISILEALSYGQYIISTNVGGIPGIIDKKSGTLINPGDKEAIYSALHHIISNDKWKSDNAYRQESIKNNLPSNIAQKLTKLYNTILNS